MWYVYTPNGTFILKWHCLNQSWFKGCVQQRCIDITRPFLWMV